MSDIKSNSIVNDKGICKLQKKIYILEVELLVLAVTKIVEKFDNNI